MAVNEIEDDRRSVYVILGDDDQFIELGDMEDFRIDETNNFRDPAPGDPRPVALKVPEGGGWYWDCGVLGECDTEAEAIECLRERQVRRGVMPPFAIDSDEPEAIVSALIDRMTPTKALEIGQKLIERAEAELKEAH